MKPFDTSKQKDNTIEKKKRASEKKILNLESIIQTIT